MSSYKLTLVISIIFSLFEDEIGLLYTLTVDGLEVILHRDDMIACFAPFGLAPIIPNSRDRWIVQEVGCGGR